MRVDLKGKNLLFKTKNTNKQLASSNSNHEGDKWHNSVNGGRMYSGEAEVAYLVGEHLQTYIKKT